MREPAVVGMPSVQKMSLTAIGTARRPVGLPLPADRCSSLGWEVQRYALSSSVEATCRHADRYSAGDSSFASIALLACRAVSSRISAISGLGLRRGNAEGAVGGVRRLREDLLARPARARLVGPQDVIEVDDVRGRLDPLEVELVDAVDVLENPRELARHRLDLVVCEPEAGEAGDVQHLLAIDHRADSR